MPTSFDIIFENEDFIVINKPSGLLSIPDRMQSTVSLKELLQQRFEEIYTIHRLDKETSGLILFAKNKEAHQKFSQLFENREVEKYYLGIVLGVPQPYEKIIEEPIHSHAKIANKMEVNYWG
jgi:23S rRNA pseudouridine955/2504/2580 synthase/23S rRNA pseudouridine1911/1915/1917 synthase